MSSFIIVALCCAAISFTVTTTSIFKFLRDVVSKIHPKLDELIHCPWCFNHYVVLLALCFIKPMIHEVWIVGFIVTWFGLVGLGGIIHYILLRAYESVAKATAIRKLEERRKQNAKLDNQSIL